MKTTGKRRGRKMIVIKPIPCLGPNSPNCPKCGAPPAEQEVRDHDLIMHDGKVYCKRCGSFVRDYDAG